MTTDTLITLAIHTYRVAVELKHSLEAEGIACVLQSVDLQDDTKAAAGVRVRIKAADLAKALRIVENNPQSAMASAEMKLAGFMGTLLIPVDFSSNSSLAVKVGFDLACRLKLKPVLLHAYVTPYFNGSLGVDQGAGDPDVNRELLEAGEAVTADREAARLMDALVRSVKEQIAAGTLPSMEFSWEVCEGIPEEVILGYIRQQRPSLVVMATRSATRRSSEMIGSVTAEVLDSCRVPLFVVPENHDIPSIKDMDRVVYFCNLDQQDILQMDIFQRFFTYPTADMYLVPVNERAGSSVADRIRTLQTYFTSAYPRSRFTSLVLPSKTFRVDFERAMVEHDLQLIVIPNKKRNVFARLFNPSIAHRLLFEKDVPMLVLPA